MNCKLLLIILIPYTAFCMEKEKQKIEFKIAQEATEIAQIKWLQCMYTAIADDKVNIVKKLRHNLSEYPDDNQIKKYTINCFIEDNFAPENGHESKFSFNNTDTPLMRACWFNRKKIVKELLYMGANVNVGDKDNRTALYNACSRTNDASLIRRLLKYGALVDIKAPSKLSLLHLAKTPEIISLLINAGASTELRDSSGNTPLPCTALSFMHNVRNKEKRAAKALNKMVTLISYGALIKPINENNFTIHTFINDFYFEKIMQLAEIEKNKREIVKEIMG